MYCSASQNNRQQATGALTDMADHFASGATVAARGSKAQKFEPGFTDSYKNQN